MTPYIWGGGHGSFESSGYDCSGAVSFALHGGGFLESPLDSTGLETWGEPGPGKWITVYANAEHAWMMIAGLAFDTVGGPGPRWHSSPVDSPEGFIVRHPPGYYHPAVRQSGIESPPLEPISYLQAIILGALQGIAEPFPISSLGHAVIAADPVRLEHPPERRILPLLPGRHPLRDRDRPLLLLPRGLEADLPRAGRSVRGRATPRTPTPGSAG